MVVEISKQPAGRESRRAERYRKGLLGDRTLSQRLPHVKAYASPVALGVRTAVAVTVAIGAVVGLAPSLPGRPGPAVTARRAPFRGSPAVAVAVRAVPAGLVLIAILSGGRETGEGKDCEGCKDVLHLVPTIRKSVLIRLLSLPLLRRFIISFWPYGVTK